MSADLIRCVLGWRTIYNTLGKNVRSASSGGKRRGKNAGKTSPESGSFASSVDLVNALSGDTIFLMRTLIAKDLELYDYALTLALAHHRNATSEMLGSAPPTRPVLESH